MGISYGMVAREQVVLAEFSATQTNASTVARKILDRMKEANNDSNSSFSHDCYIFHVKRTDGLTVLCLADDSSETSAFAMNDEFSRILSQQMDHFSKDPTADRLNRLKEEMSQVRSVMVDNIEKLLERGDRLALLVEKTSTMQGNAIRFKSQARRYKNAIWWRDFKFTATLILMLLLIIVYVLLTFFCNGLFLSSCFYAL
ncbi:vesicle-associated membrane protein 713-like isoform X2 [Durio zibethinus]|uniref:Vesicle-associated membrane protein 713-like isoform X2 n=1 Tax=Durio zibethinus TaxID=66656 RepID=A0A6P5ZFV6_DURZI|nr:vesicle-associated membrane protein 713-like isoform X2 [Durio zibethinus]